MKLVLKITLVLISPSFISVTLNGNSAVIFPGLVRVPAFKSTALIADQSVTLSAVTKSLKSSSVRASVLSICFVE